jgi:hypothetical protein
LARRNFRTYYHILAAKADMVAITRIFSIKTVSKDRQVKDKVWELIMKKNGFDAWSHIIMNSNIWVEKSSSAEVIKVCMFLKSEKSPGLGKICLEKLTLTVDIWHPKMKMI